MAVRVENVSFERLENGRVKVTYHWTDMTRSGDYENQDSVVIEPDDWASIVASVSSRGKDAGSIAEALEFHWS